ncbi:MAG: hypothetical protein M1151_04185 [Candidatus Thermoplasmatota archaeon]|jgi:hypothetical protein|nr:hypothetical protein [Candidatus Thermoplasmatota archaeon]MCL5785854.1 hypothetical protein [Candidatus Thermoplasmatota archaeon]
MLDFTLLASNLFILVLGISIVLDIIMLAASARARIRRKMRILSAFVISYLVILFYLIAIVMNVFGYLQFSVEEASVYLVFLLLIIFYAGMMRGI